MKRLMPYRDYDEHDVVNLFALNTSNNSILDTGDGDAGVIVCVKNGTITADAVTLASAGYLGKTDYPYVGRDYYPSVSLTVGAAATGDAPIGITLFETAMYDENNEKLLYYQQKALENQIVLSGQAVPVATRGLFAMDESMFVGGTVPAPASKLVIGSGSGKFDVLGASGAGSTVYGVVLATGQRVAGNTADAYAGAAGATGSYAIARINFN